MHLESLEKNYIKKIGLYCRTIKYLRPIQIRYRLWYAIRNKFRELTGHTYSFNVSPNTQLLDFDHSHSLTKPDSVKNRSFAFLNNSQTFTGKIDWNYNEYGKLWAYNLNYFDYLLNEEMTEAKGLHLIKEFVDQIQENREGLEPYPISVRGINWIKFLIKHKIQNTQIDKSLYIQYKILLDNIEYHVLGNHLLENGCSLLFGSFYFNDTQLWKKSRKIILNQLDEQILNDGGHFEKSAMYHCIMLERLLDCYNLLQHNSLFQNQDDLAESMATKIRIMLGWLDQIKWEGGGLPEVNDYVPEMTPSSQELFDYAHQLNLFAEHISLDDSGYRKYRGEHFELLADVGNIGPDYIPGHAHSDIFSFILQIDGKAIITDTGTSTYENNARRSKERSTSSHNTVMVEETEQNETWSAFRVGRRGKVTFQKDAKDEIIAAHDGYRFMSVTHRRHFNLGDEEIIIKDELVSDTGNISANFYVHFAPGINIEQKGNLIRGGLFTISFSEHASIDITDYEKSEGYNIRKPGKKAVISFKDTLETSIKILRL